MIIIHANILTMENENFEDGYIIMQDTKIADLGDMKHLDISVYADVNILDVKGAVILPGFVDAHTHLGLFEDGLGFEGDDGNEDTDPVTPNLRAIDGINPFDRCFVEALHAGVTTVATGPGSANPIAGLWCAMKTKGRCVDEMLIDDAIGMKFALGENPKETYNSKNQGPVTRMATAALIREQMEKTRRYLEDIEKAKADDDYDMPEYDAKCEAMIPVIRKEIKAFFHAHRADDICTAIRISKEYDLDYVLIHATEGHLIPEILDREKADVVLGPIICDRSKPELKGHQVTTASVLSKNHVQFAICTDHPETPIQYLLLSCSICMTDSLTQQELLKAVTINAAKICGIDNRVGSIKPGKDADLLVFSYGFAMGNTKPDMVFLEGHQVI